MHRSPRTLIIVPLLLFAGAALVWWLQPGQHETLRGSVLSPDAEEVHATLQAVLDYGMADAESVEDMVATLSFAHVFTSMTLDALLLTLLDEGMIEGYADLPSLRQGLIDRELTGFARELDAWGEAPMRDIDMLRPDGALTALATSLNGAILSGGPLASVLEWERANRAKELLRESFEEDRVRFLRFFEPLHLLSLFADEITTSADDPPRDIAMYSWNPMVISPGATHIHPMIHLQASSSPVDVKAILDTVPPGHRVIRPQTILSVPKPHDLGDDSLVDHIPGENGDSLILGNGSPYVHPSLTMDRWKEIVSERLDTFFAEYKAIGGEVDHVIIDIENSWIARQSAERMDYLQAMENWPQFAERFAEVGLTDFANVGTWNAHRDYRLTRWNAVAHDIQTKYMNSAIYHTITRHFPEITMSNYWNANRNQTIPIFNYLHFKNSYHGIGSLLGTHQSDSSYDLGIDGITWIPNSSSDGRGQRAFDEPEPRANTHVREIEGVNGIVTIRTFDPLTGVEEGDYIRVRLYRCGEGVVPTAENNLEGIDIYTDVYHGLYSVLSIGPDPDSPGTSLLTVALPGDHPYMGFGFRRTCHLYVTSSNYYNVLVQNVKMMRTMVSTSSVPTHPWVWYYDEQRARRGWDNTDYYYADELLHIGMHNPDAILYWNSTVPCTYCLFDSHCVSGTCDREANMCIEPGHSDCDAGTLYTDHILREISDIAGFENAKGLSRTAVFFHEPYMLSGIDAGGRKVWRFTPDDRKEVNVLSSSPARFSLDGEVVEFPHGEIYEHERGMDNPFYDGDDDMGFWIIQKRPGGILNTTPETALRILEGRTPQVVEHTAEGEHLIARVGEQTSFLLAGFDPESPPVGRNIVSLPVKLQGLSMPKRMLGNSMQFVKLPYNIGIAQGEIYVLAWTPTEEEIGTHTLRMVTEEGVPKTITVEVIAQ